MNRDTLSQPTLFDNDKCVDNEVQTLVISRDLSYENAADVIQAVTSSLAKQPCEIKLDMSRVSLIDSSGLRALLQSRKLCEESNTEFSLLGVCAAVERVIAMSGFAGIFGMRQIEQDTYVRGDSGTVPPDNEEWKVLECQSISDSLMVSVLRSKIMNVAAAAGASGDIFCDIQIAVGEALTNAFRHGSPNKGVDKIKLRCMTCSRAIVIEIEDEGEPFDSESICEPDPSCLRDHGMGIFLMRRAMDVVEFHTHCPGNRVRMIKWLNC
ncbi:ATP-binding protein [bacterium]|nr:ATP-binding protein [bacterium]